MKVLLDSQQKKYEFVNILWRKKIVGNLKVTFSNSTFDSKSTLNFPNSILILFFVTRLMKISSCLHMFIAAFLHFYLGICLCKQQNILFSKCTFQQESRLRKREVLKWCIGIFFNVKNDLISKHNDFLSLFYHCNWNSLKDNNHFF
jgi:hypothetical protein